MIVAGSLPQSDQSTAPGPAAAGSPALHVACAWCKSVIREGDHSQPWSHGICKPCSAKLRPVRISGHVTLFHRVAADELGATVEAPARRERRA